jgi:hypothetical protein
MLTCISTIGRLRDLTRECIEPNPGPTHTLADLIKAVNERLNFDKERAHYANSIKEFESAVLGHAGQEYGVTVAHARAFLADDEAVKHALKNSYNYLSPLLREGASINSLCSSFNPSFVSPIILPLFCSFNTSG